VVADDLVDDETQEFLREFRIEIRVGGEAAEAGDLLLLATGVGRRQTLFGS
jgi:hypothetical protein